MEVNSPLFLLLEAFQRSMTILVHLWLLPEKSSLLTSISTEKLGINVQVDGSHRSGWLRVPHRQCMLGKCSGVIAWGEPDESGGNQHQSVRTRASRQLSRTLLSFLLNRQGFRGELRFSRKSAAPIYSLLPFPISSIESSALYPLIPYPKGITWILVLHVMVGNRYWEFSFFFNYSFTSPHKPFTAVCDKPSVLCHRLMWKNNRRSWFYHFWRVIMLPFAPSEPFEEKDHINVCHLGKHNFVLWHE